jgi:hypothetical protein
VTRENEAMPPEILDKKTLFTTSAALGDAVLAAIDSYWGKQLGHAPADRGRPLS